MRTAQKTVECPCGNIVHVHPQFLLLTECWECGRVASSGNERTGEISSWMTVEETNRAEDEIAAQQFTCDDVNDW